MQTVVVQHPSMYYFIPSVATCQQGIYVDSRQRDVAVVQQDYRARTRRRLIRATMRSVGVRVSRPLVSNQ